VWVFININNPKNMDINKLIKEEMINKNISEGSASTITIDKAIIAGFLIKMFRSYRIEWMKSIVDRYVDGDYEDYNELRQIIIAMDDETIKRMLLDIIS
jgi:hypothetical protein